MSEELIEEDGLARVTSKWTRDELNGKTVSFTEKGGREDILWLGVIYVDLVGDGPGKLVVSVTTEGSEGRVEFDVNQEIMDALVRGSGRQASDFHISLPMLHQRSVEV